MDSLLKYLLDSIVGILPFEVNDILNIEDKDGALYIDVNDDKSKTGKKTYFISALLSDEEYKEDSFGK